MFWRTYATAVVLFMGIVSTIAAHDSVSDRAVLTLQGTVSYHVAISIRPLNGECVVEAATNTPGGIALSVELPSGGDDSSLMINGVPARFENGCARVADVRPGMRDDIADGTAIAYAGAASPVVTLDVAAR